MVPMRCNEPKVPRPTSEIKLFDKKSRRKNLIPLNEVESNFFISLNDKFNTFNTVFLAKAPLKKVYHVMPSHHIIYSFARDQFASFYSGQPNPPTKIGLSILNLTGPIPIEIYQL